MKKIEAFIFDMDGTLVDSVDAIVASVRHMLGALSLPDRPREEIVSFIGTGEEELVSKSTGRKGDIMIEEARKIYRDHFLGTADASSRLFPGVIEILEHYRDRYLSVITNRSLQTAENTLNNFGIKRYFSDVTGGDDDGCRKPDGCVIRRILTGRGYPAEKSMIVGDMDIDILTGKDSGIYTCAVTYGIGNINDLKAADPDFIIDRIEGLKGIAG